MFVIQYVSHDVPEMVTVSCRRRHGAQEEVKLISHTFLKHVFSTLHFSRAHLGGSDRQASSESQSLFNSIPLARLLLWCPHKQFRSNGSNYRNRFRRGIWNLRNYNKLIITTITTHFSQRLGGVLHLIISVWPSTFLLSSPGLSPSAFGLDKQSLSVKHLCEQFW